MRLFPTQRLSEVMNPDGVKEWLVKKQKLGFFQNVLLGIVVLVAGIVVLFLTFWFTYAIIWFGWHGVTAISELVFSKKLHLSHELRLIFSGIFVALLFVQHFRTSPWHWGDYPKDDYVSAPGLQSPGGAFGGISFMLAYPGASSNMVADILLTGPRLMLGSLQLVKKGFALKHLDAEGCSKLLAFLLTQDHLVSFLDLEAAGWEPWFENLRHIDGVQFLERGVILSEELRQELNGLSET